MHTINCAWLFIIAMIPLYVNGQTIYFEQDFSNPSVNFQHSPAGVNQVDILFARPNTTSSYAIQPGHISFYRSGPGESESNTTGGSVHFLRHTPFTPIPTSMYYEFTINIPTSVMEAHPGAYFYVGNALDYTPSPKILQPNAKVFSKIAVYLSPTNTYKLRDINLNRTSADLSGSKNITWVMNKQGQAISYLAPNGNTEALGHGKYDIWIGTERWVANASAVSDVPLSNISFAYYNGSGEIQLSNLRIRDIAGILPLPLLQFSVVAHQLTAQLNWQVPTHESVQKFEIERSTDGSHFETINQMSSSVNTYQFQYTDTSPEISQNYYRLKIYSDDKILYSPIEMVSFTTTPYIFPNPVEDQTILLSVRVTELKELQLWSISGQSIQINHIELTSNGTKIIPSAPLHSGIYLLKINSSNSLLRIIVP